MALVGKGAVGVGTGRRKKREEDERKTARSVRREQAERKKRREQAERKKIAPPGYRLPDYEPKAPKPQVYEPPVPLARPPMQNLGVGAPAVEYRPPSVELQLKNLTTAYYKLHDSFPTAPQALILLNTAPGFPRTVKEWEEFLAPGVKSGELPQPGDVETEAMRVDDLDVIGSPLSTAVTRYGVFAPTEKDRPLFYELHENTDPRLARMNLDKLLAIREKTSKPAETAWEQRQHDLLLSDVKPFKEEMAERLRSLGEKVDFDATTGEVDGATVDLYKRWVAAPQYSELLYGDGEAMERAANVLKPMIGSEELDWWLNIREVVQDGGYVTDDVLETTYDANIFGRPVGYDERSARWDYIARYGMDKLPQKAHKVALEEQKTIDDAFALIAKPFEWAFGATEWLWDKISPVDVITEQLSENPQYCGKTVAAAASFVHDLGHEFANGELFGKAVGYGEQAAVALYAMLSMAAGYTTLEGELVEGSWRGAPAGKEGDYGALLRASEWARAWRYGEGKMIVDEVSHRVAPILGLDPDNPYLRSLVVLADYGVVIAGGAKVDTAMWKTAKPLWTKTYAGMRKVDAEAKYLKNHFSDARLKVFGSPGAQRGSFVVRGIETTDDDTAAAMNALLDERDLALAASGARRAEDVTGTMSQDVDIYQRIKELGIRREGNDYWDDSLGVKNQTIFRGTIRKDGLSMDEVASIIASGFPGSSIANATDKQAALFEFLKNYKGSTKPKRTPKPEVSKSPLAELRAKVAEAPDDELEAVVGAIDDTVLPGISEYKPTEFFAETPLTGPALRTQVLSMIDRSMRSQRYADSAYAVEAVTRIDRLLADLKEGKALSADDARFLEEVTGKPFAGRRIGEEGAAARRVTEGPDVFAGYYGKSTATKTKAGAAAADANLAWRRNPSPETFEAAKAATLEYLRRSRSPKRDQKIAEVEAIQNPLERGRAGEVLVEEEFGGQQAIFGAGERRLEKQMDMGLEGGTKAPRAELPKEQMPGQVRVEVPAAAKSPLVEALESIEPPPPAKPPAKPPEAPTAAGLPPSAPDYRRVSWFLRNNVEALTYGTSSDDVALVRILADIDDAEEFKPFVKAIARERNDPQKVLEIIYQLKKEHGLRGNFDPFGWGILKLARTASWERGFKGRNDIFRLLATPIAYHRIIPDRDADLHVLQFGTGVKMGRKKMTRDDAAQLRDFSNRIYLAESTKKRNDILNEFWGVIEKNMREEGTWDEFLGFSQQIYEWRSSKVIDLFRQRAYGHGKDTPPAGYARDLAAQVKRQRERLLETVDDAKERARVRTELKRIEERLDDYKEAARLIRANKEKPGSVPAAKLDWAHGYMDELGYPEPIWTFQLQKNLRHAHDPRLLAWFQAGRTARTLMRFDALILERTMRWWKMMVMSSVGFPFNVFMGDEGIRLISEGIIPHRVKGTVEVQRELFGQKLTRGERAELRRLEELSPDEIGEVQMSRLQELEAKQRGKLTESEMKLFHGENYYDWAEELSDSWSLITPDDANYFRTLRGYLSELSREPLVKLFVNEKRGAMPRGRDEISAWIERQILAQDKNGAALRNLLVESGRITAKQEDVRKLTKILASGDLTGAPGNVRALIETWTDILECIRVDERLIEAVKSGSATRTAELAKIPREHLWPIPGKLSMGTGRDNFIWRGFGGDWRDPKTYGKGAATVATYAWLPKFYERVTMNILKSFSDNLRTKLFSDAYGRELRAIVKDSPDLDPKLAHKIAFDRALSYTNKTTFVRNATIAEDVLRDYIPFINSYRQFWVYWLKVLGRHPFAMATAYEYHPSRGELMGQVGPFEVVVPQIPFWIPQTEEEETFTGALASQTPSVCPFISSGIAGLARWAGVKGDLSTLPFMGGTARSMAPLSSITPLFYGLTGRDIFGTLGSDVDVFDKRHGDLLRAYAPSGKVERGDFEDIDYPPYLEIIDDALRTLGVDNPRPELVLQYVTKQFLGRGLKTRPEIVRQIRDGYWDTRDMSHEEERKYRAEHPYYDILQRYYETSDGDRRNQLLAQHEWLYPFTVSDYVWSDAANGLILTDEDFARLRDEDRVRRKTDAERMRAFERKAIAIWGGKGADDVPRVSANGRILTGYPGDLTRPQAEMQAEAAVKDAEEWVRRQAERLSKGNKKFYDDLISDWKNADEALPGILHDIAVREAKAAGEDPDAYERGLIPALIWQDFYDVHGTAERMADDQPSAALARKVNDLADSGYLPPKVKELLLESGPHTHLLENYRYEEEIDTRKKLIDEVVNEQFYDLDARKLRQLGVKCGPKLDIAIYKVRDHYYNVYQKVVEKYGSQSKEGRKARNEFHAFKDKVFSKVKGGEALAGGVAERVLHIPYFTDPQFDPRSEGPSTPEQQKLWGDYLAAARDPKTSPKKLREYHEKFTPYQTERFAELRRAAHHVYVAGVALWMRAKMKYSYSEYYQGPGNSVYSNAGKRMVARLDKLMRDTIREDKRLLGASEFARDIKLYFGSTKTYASAALEWYYK